MHRDPQHTQTLQFSFAACVPEENSMQVMIETEQALRPWADNWTHTESQSLTGFLSCITGQPMPCRGFFFRPCARCASRRRHFHRQNNWHVETAMTSDQSALTHFFMGHCKLCGFVFQALSATPRTSIRSWSSGSCMTTTMTSSFTRRSTWIRYRGWVCVCTCVRSPELV